MSHLDLPAVRPNGRLALPLRFFTRPRRLSWRWTALLLPLLVTALVLAPLLVLVAEWLNVDPTLWRHLAETTLPTMLRNTLGLTLGVGLGTGLLGTGLAWLVTMYQFPGRGLFERLLFLPLAVPTFVMGFVYMATFDFAGPVQSQWRAWFGAEAYFPDIRSLGGAILVLTLVLYPYVYILARAAFREQAASTFEAAQVMGYGRTATFFRLVLPLARPSLAAGVTLAMIEALTDYGAVRFFSVSTLSEGIIRLWEGYTNRDAAIQLASVLLLVALGLITLERLLRGKARYYQQGAARRRPVRILLRGPKAGLAIFLCVAVLGAAFFLPVFQLTVWAVREINAPTVGAWREVYGLYIFNTVRLAGVAGLVVIMAALLVVHGLRVSTVGRTQPKWARRVSRLMTLGYAMPGAVVAIGVLVLVAPLDHQVTDWAEQYLGRTERSLLFTGTMTGLVYAYLVRFMAVGLNSVESSFEKLTPSLTEAARTAGARPLRILWRIHLPLVSAGLSAGLLLVVVDAMKELPATLLLRPFGMDTLALWAYFLAAESFWQAAAIPALTILGVGLIPVVILMRVGGYGAERHST